MSDKHNLQIIFEEIGYKVRPYEGRGMGKSCLAAYLKSCIGDMFADIIESLGETRPIDMDKLEPFEDISNAFRKMRTDAMGKGMIVYFPTVEYVDDVEDEDDTK